jgi:hypothetical protein
MIPPFLTSTLDGSEWSDSRRFNPGERVPSNDCVEGWVRKTQFRSLGNEGSYKLHSTTVRHTVISIGVIFYFK